jgi:hypothetical protein
MSASYRVKFSYSDRDVMSQVQASTVGAAILSSHEPANGKPESVSVQVLLRRPGAESWIACYVSPEILGLL